MTQARAQIVSMSYHDEQAVVPELVVTIRLTLGPGPATPETARLTELIARLSAGGPEEMLTGITREGLDPYTVAVYPESRTVLRGATDVSLTRREFDLLLCLADHPYQVFTRSQLLAQVWGNGCTGQRSVDVHILRLRAKLGMDVPLVTTLRGVGYRLHDDARVIVVRDH